MRSKSLFTLLLCAAIFSTGHSQSLKLWTWNSYNMRFKIPDNMSIVYNDNTRFEATNQVITIDIYPRKGEDLTYSGMKNAIVAWAQQEQLRYNYYNKYNNEQPIYLKDLNRYWGCAIDGTKGGNPATMLLLVNPDNPDISLYVWIAYNDDYYQDVMQILESFEPM